MHELQGDIDESTHTTLAHRLRLICVHTLGAGPNTEYLAYFDTSVEYILNTLGC